MNLRQHSWMALGLCTVLGAAACGDDDISNDDPFPDTGAGPGTGGDDLGPDNGTPDAGMGNDMGMGMGNDMGMGMGMGDDMGVDMGEDMGPVTVESITVAPATRTLQANAMETLIVRANFSDGSMSRIAPADLVFESNDEGIASVSAAGVVTGISVGMATITATFEAEGGSIFTAQSVITVEEDPCPNGTEGCECTATAGRTDENLNNDLCDIGLVCVPLQAYNEEGIDIISADTIDPSANFIQRPDACLRQCDVDADCDGGQFCSTTAIIGSPFLFGSETGFCVDEVATFEETCSLSRYSGALLEIDTDGDTVPDFPVQKEIDSRLVGCDTGMTCFQNLIGAVLGPTTAPDDLLNSPDEGTCIAACESDADCAGFPGRETCNFIFGETRGICNDRALGLGAIGAENPSPLSGPNASELATTLPNRCSAAAPFTLDFGNVGPAVRVCYEICGNMNPCSLSTGPDDAQTCVQPNPNAIGLCSSECQVRDSVNDTLCPSDRSCLAINLNFRLPTDNMDFVGPLAVCRESLEPVYQNLVEVGPNGTFEINSGDDCTPNDESQDLFRCPPKTTCFNVGGAGNVRERCIAPCEFVESSTVSDGYCEGINGVGSVCTDQRQLEMNLGATGVCSTP